MLRFGFNIQLLQVTIYLINLPFVNLVRQSPGLKSRFVRHDANKIK